MSQEEILVSITPPGGRMSTKNQIMLSVARGFAVDKVVSCFTCCHRAQRDNNLG